MSQAIQQTGVAIVTGAAGGMGLPAATRLAAQGWPLILCDLNAARLDEAAGGVRRDGLAVATVAGDLADPACRDGLIAALDDRPIGALIHTAGLSPTMADGPRIFAVNLETTMRLVDAVRPRMAAGGCAVLIASSSGYQMKSDEIDAALDAFSPGDDLAPLLVFGPDSGRAYSLSKRGVIRLVRRQAAAFGAVGARIVSISPGLIDTSMGRAEFAAHSATAAMRDMTPLDRLGIGDEIASVATFLCSSDASFVSGIDIPVDGGMLAATGYL